MKQFDLPTGSYIGVEVGKDAHDFVIDELLSPYLQYWEGDKDTVVDLPPGQWSLIGENPLQLTESECAEVVESKKERGSMYNHGLGHYQSAGWTTYYKNYQHPEPSVCIPNTALESYQSLLLSLGLGKSVVLLKLKK